MTRPMHDTAAIANDARRVYHQAMIDEADPELAKRVSKLELQLFLANIEALDRGDAARTTTLDAQVACGAHAAKARAALVHAIRDIRDDAKITFGAGSELARAFGYGVPIAPESTIEVRRVAMAVHLAAETHPAEAAKIGLDAHALQHFEDLLHALDGADAAHALARTERHTETTSTDSVAHVVAAETAHIRLVARRVYRGDEAKLAAYKTTLARRRIDHTAETPPAAAPAKAPS